MMVACLLLQVTLVLLRVFFNMPRTDDTQIQCQNTFKANSEDHEWCSMRHFARFPSLCCTKEEEDTAKKWIT